MPARCHICMLRELHICMHAFTNNVRCHSCRLGGSPCMYHDWTVREAPSHLAKEYKNEWCRHPIWRIRGVTSYSIGSGYVTAFGIPFITACKPIGVDGRSLTKYMYIYAD